ncbi:MAG TPA: hypothetical protein VK593_05960, partial [Edaphobacter sp.]|nr:hypothetical protein [Edaphobacter sp.]
MRGRRRIPLGSLLLCPALAAAIVCCLPLHLQAQNVDVRTITDLPMEPGKPLPSYALTEDGLHAELLYLAPHNSAPAELLYTVWKGDGPRSFQPDRSIPIERRMQLFAPLFRQFLATDKRPATFSLHIYGFSEFDDRLATLAAQDPGWDLRRGRPKKKLPGYDY